MYVKELRLAERRYHRGLSDRLSTANLRNDPHHWWTVLKKACGWKVREVIPPLVQDNQLHLDEKDKAEVQNSFFAQQCSAPSKVFDQQLPVHVGEQFTFSKISVAFVAKELHSLNVWKASGLDQTSAIC